MCFRSAAEGQKAFRGRAASSISLHSEARKPEWQRNQGRLELERGARIGEKESLRVVLDLDFNLNGRSEVTVDRIQAQSPIITRGARS